MTTSRDTALNKIRAEHRTLAAVVNNLKAMIVEVRAGRIAMDFPLFWLMIHYIDSFSDQFHHPKENDWLFKLVKLRTSAADALILELLAQHALEPAALANLRKYLGNFEAGVPGSVAALDAAIQAYADFTWKHLRAEEHEFFAFADAHLTASDWDQIAQAFSENKDPLDGHQDGQHFAELFREILHKTPAPLGLA